jgi:hypothetical protein
MSACSDGRYVVSDGRYVVSDGRYVVLRIYVPLAVHHCIFRITVSRRIAQPPELEACGRPNHFETDDNPGSGAGPQSILFRLPSRSMQQSLGCRLHCRRVWRSQSHVGGWRRGFGGSAKPPTAASKLAPATPQLPLRRARVALLIMLPPHIQSARNI